MAVSEVRINQKRNLKKQVFCKTDVLKYSLKSQYDTCTGVSFLMTLHALKPQTESMKIMHFCIN